MNDFKVARWLFNNIYTVKHIIYKPGKSSTIVKLLCNRVYPYDHELVITHQRVMIDDVDCIGCIEKFGEIAVSRYEENRIKNPITLRLGM